MIKPELIFFHLIFAWERDTSNDEVIQGTMKISINKVNGSNIKKLYWIHWNCDVDGKVQIIQTAGAEVAVW